MIPVTEYADQKRVWDDTAARCRSRGVLFVPIMCTARGVLEPGAAKSLEVIHKAVADNTGSDLPGTRAAFAEKLSITIVRANARAARRRDPDGPENAGTAGIRHARRASEAYEYSRLLRAPPGGADEESVVDALGEGMASTSLT